MSASESARLGTLLRQTAARQAADTRPSVRTSARTTAVSTEASLDNPSGSGGMAVLVGVKLQGDPLLDLEPQHREFRLVLKRQQNGQVFEDLVLLDPGPLTEELTSLKMDFTPHRKIELVKGVDYLNLASGGDPQSPSFNLGSSRGDATLDKDEAAATDRLFGTKAYKTAGYAETIT